MGTSKKFAFAASIIIYNHKAFIQLASSRYHQSQKVLQPATKFSLNCLRLTLAFSFVLILTCEIKYFLQHYVVNQHVYNFEIVNNRSKKLPTVKIGWSQNNVPIDKPSPWCQFLEEQTTLRNPFCNRRTKRGQFISCRKNLCN